VEVVPAYSETDQKAVNYRPTAGPTTTTSMRRGATSLSTRTRRPSWDWPTSSRLIR
jgi:hypothetical protein